MFVFESGRLLQNTRIVWMFPTDEENQFLPFYLLVFYLLFRSQFKYVVEEMFTVLPMCFYFFQN